MLKADTASSASNNCLAASSREFPMKMEENNKNKLDSWQHKQGGIDGRASPQGRRLKYDEPCGVPFASLIRPRLPLQILISEMADEKPGGSFGGSQSNGFFVREKCTREELKIAVNVAIERFRHDEEQKELSFPSSLTSSERAYVHLYCQSFGLKTKSHGRGNQRSLTVYKKENQAKSATSEVLLSPRSREAICELLEKFPVTNKERQDLGQKRIFKGSSRDNSKAVIRENKFSLGSSPQIPPKARENDTSGARAKLPIFSFKEKLLKSFKNNQVTLITGDTGCGKTTQVGQYILEDAAKRQQACKVICTQPRRISAISVADRVAFERGEQIGHTVGYQIRLETRVSMRTALLYCTNGVLLRLLMAGHKALNNITHIIIDEIHERDKFSDYLLICLRDHLKSYRNLKVILMSAALNIELFKDYFGSCPVIHIPTMCHKVESYFLEDVLQMTGYMNKAMKKLVKEIEGVNVLKKSHEKLVAGNVKLLKRKESEPEVVSMSEETKPSTDEVASDKEIKLPSDLEGKEEKLPEAECPGLEDIPIGDLTVEDDCSHFLDPEVRKEMDTCLKTVWEDGNEDLFDQVIHLILNENVHVDYQHSETSMTALMIASARGYVNLVEQLLEFGAEAELKDRKQNWSAVDWARNFNQGHIVSLFDHFNEAREDPAEELPEEQQIPVEISKDIQERLEMYHNTFDDDKVDHNLIMSLISYICKSKQEGAILVFLPGYDDIVGVKDRLFADSEFSKQNKYIIYMLHSMMQPVHQRKVFRRPQSGMRKIILSTNIAETSVTIDDVVFVIDSGRVKEKTFEALTSVSALRSVWISKASALQRRGRAGRCRPGQCFHLMSRCRFHGLALYQEAELLRTPIHELCLQTKLLAAVNVSIADFLSKAPEPPSFLMIHNSISLLKAIDALDDEEELTELGKLLVDLPIDPRLGKMILFGIVTKCLDSVLTIASCLAYREPFVLPISSDDKRKANAAKAKFSGLSFSDHVALLRAYQEWSKAREEGSDKSFCNKNFVSSAAMEMISGMRNQMVCHLRSLGLIRQRYGDMKDLNTNSQNWPVVKAAVLAGVYPSMLHVDKESKKIVGNNEKNVRVHPSSVLSPAEGKVSNLPYDWLYYDEMTRMHVAVQVRCLSVVPAVTVALLAGSSLSCDVECLRHSSEKNGGGKDRFSYDNSDSENEDKSRTEAEDDKAILKVDDWICFHGDDETLELLMSMKIKFLSSFVRKIASDGKSWSQADDAVIQCFVNVLAAEESLTGQSGLESDEAAGRKVNGNGRGEKSVWSPGNRAQSRSNGTKRSDNSRGREGDRAKPKVDSRDKKFDRQRGKERREENEAREQMDRGTGASNQGNRENSKKDDRYFIVKCNNYKNLDISMSKGIWATTKGNERKLDRAFRDAENVYLIFSIQGSGNFQGFARMLSGVTGETCPEFGSANLGGVFSIQWVCKGDVAFHYTQDLVNPWNENKKVQISRDGQELEPSVGEALCSFWNQVLPPVPASQHRSATTDYHAEQSAAMQQQLDPSQAYSVVEGHPQPQMFLTDPGHAAMYSNPYGPAEVHEMQPQYHPHAVYTPQMPGYAPQPIMHPRYQGPEMYHMHQQSFIPYRRQGSYGPRGVHYYPHQY